MFWFFNLLSLQSKCTVFITKVICTDRKRQSDWCGVEWLSVNILYICTHCNYEINLQCILHVEYPGAILAGVTPFRLSVSFVGVIVLV